MCLQEIRHISMQFPHGEYKELTIASYIAQWLTIASYNFRSSQSSFEFSQLMYLIASQQLSFFQFRLKYSGNINASPLKKFNYVTMMSQGDDVILDELNIEVQIYSQYVSVSVDAVVFNPHDGVQLADFNLRLHEQAFISYFHM